MPGERDRFGLAAGSEDWVRARLLERRTVLLCGELDDPLVTRVSAELIMLDATGDEPILMHVDSAGGPLRRALTLIDTLDLLSAPVHATCIGRAEGAAIGVLSAANLRSAAPHARFRLCEPTTAGAGKASAIDQAARDAHYQLEAFAARLARASGRPAEHIEADLEAGRWLNADDALEYGLIDEIWRSKPS